MLRAGWPAKPEPANPPPEAVSALRVAIPKPIQNPISVPKPQKMLTYEVQVKIDAEVEPEWFKWMKTKHVPDVLATGLMKSHRIFKPEGEAQRYCFQYDFATREDYETYQKIHAPVLRDDLINTFPERFTASRQIYHWL